MLYSYRKFKVGDLDVVDGKYVSRCCSVKKVKVSQDDIDDEITNLNLWDKAGWHYDIEFEDITGTEIAKKFLAKKEASRKKYESARQEVEKDNDFIQKTIAELKKYPLNTKMMREDAIAFSHKQFKRFDENDLIWIALKESNANWAWNGKLSKTQFSEAYDCYSIKDNAKLFEKYLKEEQDFRPHEKVTIFDTLPIHDSRFVVNDENNILYLFIPTWPNYYLIYPNLARIPSTSISGGMNRPLKAR